MENGLQGIISRIGITFPKGELSRYIAQNRWHDRQIIIMYLKGIIAGKCPDNPTENCKVKAYAMLRLLEIAE